MNQAMFWACAPPLLPLFDECLHVWKNLFRMSDLEKKVMVIVLLYNYFVLCLFLSEWIVISCFPFIFCRCIFLSFLVHHYFSASPFLAITNIFCDHFVMSRYLENAWLWFFDKDLFLEFSSKPRRRTYLLLHGSDLCITLH